MSLDVTLHKVRIAFNDVFERDCSEGLSLREVCEIACLGEEEVRKACDALMASGEVAERSTSGRRYSRLNLTPRGRLVYEKETGDPHNPTIRRQLRELIQDRVRIEPERSVESEWLAQTTGQSWNVICLNLLIMEHLGKVTCRPLAGGGHLTLRVSLAGHGA